MCLRSAILFATALALSTLPICASAQTANPPPAAAPPNGATTPAAPAPASSSDQISAERPGYTNGTDTVPAGRLQLETGFLLSTTSGVTQGHLNDGGQLRVPLSPNTEVRFVSPNYYFGGGSAAATGFTDLGLTFKWRFLEELPGRRPSVALITGTTVPSGSPQLKESHLQPVIDLEGQFNLSPLYELQVSTNYTRATDTGTEFNQYADAINLNYNLNPVATPFLELFRVAPGGGVGSPNSNYFDGGVTYVLGTNIQLDINAGVGIGSGSHGDHFVGAGFAQRW